MSYLVQSSFHIEALKSEKLALLKELALFFTQLKIETLRPPFPIETVPKKSRYIEFS